MVISVLNLLCWWPACVLYWVGLAKSLSVRGGNSSPVVTEPALIFSAVVNVANPIIYTIASKRFLTLVRCACPCCVFCKLGTKKRLRLPAFPGPDQENVKSSYWCTCCRLPHGEQTPYVEIRIAETWTDDTDSTSLFTDMDE